MNYKERWSDQPGYPVGSGEALWTTKIRELLIDGAVLDVGSGSGRFVPVFANHPYTGLDINQQSVTTGSQLYPEETWICADLVTWKPTKKYHNVFSWVSLQHIPPEHIESVLKKLRKISKNMILCEHGVEPEPQGENQYLWRHEYGKYVDIISSEPYPVPQLSLIHAKGDA